MGVWIETSRKRRKVTTRQSHPIWVCGLKPFGIAQKEAKRLSHPIWVCGLKHQS